MSENLETAVTEQEAAVVEVEAIEAEVAETEVVEVEAVEAEVAETEVVEVEAVEAEVAETEVVEVEAIEAEVAETEVVEVVEVVEVEAVEAEVAETEVVEVEAIEAEVAETEVVEVEAIEAEVVEVEASETKIVEAEAVETEVVEVEAAEAVADDAPAKPEAAEGERVVRVLSIGMEVPGVVKRTTDFGAFVDIGVGRDGLIHISELSTRRVAKVTDVVQKGQEVTAWIKELDRSRNRISLTLIAPGTKTIRDLEKDELVTGVVTRIVPYGAFIDIGVGRDALLHIREMADGYVNKPEDIVQVGETVEARIIEISRRRGRIDLSMKGLGPEPEAEEAPAQEPEEELDPEDPFEGLEVLSPMELAFQKAMNESDGEVEGVTRRRSKRARREQMRSLQDEIISRTLKSGGAR